VGKSQSGQSIPRLEDQRFLTGCGRFVADIDLDGQLYAVIVRSPHAHAEIVDVGIAGAMEVDGVVGVHTETDLIADGIGLLPCVASFPAKTPLVIPERHALARDRVRHVGDPVVMIVATSHAAALEAADLVEIDYDPLPAVTDGHAALAEGAPLLWDEAPGNVAFTFEKGDRDAVSRVMANAANVVELDIINNRVMAAPVEPRAGIAHYDAATGVKHLICTAQGLHAIRNQLATSVFKVPVERIHLSAPDVGGGFGLKNFLYPEWVLLPWAARLHRRPIKWVAERGEDHAGATHGRDIRTSARLALDEEGRFLALDADLVANMGAYLSAAGPGASTTSSPTAMGGVYDVPLIHMHSTGVFSNATPIDAYRGAGKPEANFIIERLIDAAARRCGFDPVELRRLNAITRFPHVTAQGMTLDSGRFRPNIDDAVARVDRGGFEQRRAGSAAAGKLRGLGFGCFLETARGAPQEGAEVRFTPGGRIELRVGTESNGQGHETSYRQIAADWFGLPMEAFDYIQADTTDVRIGHGHGGARSMHMGGGAMVLAIDAVLDKAREVAATLLQTAAGSLDYADGRFTVPDSDRSVSLIEVSAAARNSDVAPSFGDDGAGNVGLDTFHFREQVPFTFPNGCHAAEVEIDPDTGVVALLRYVMVDDYGTLVNPLLTEGQVHGGVAQGIGQALMENVNYDEESGQLLVGSFMDYTVPRAAHLPSFETHLEGVPTEANALGVKGSGQAGCIGAPQTIINAVLDALAPLGIDHIQMPATAETVWRAIREAKQG
jgi:aerobic carbon-monoxide dehydrogenase large subunit